MSMTVMRMMTITPYDHGALREAINIARHVLHGSPSSSFARSIAASISASVVTSLCLSIVLLPKGDEFSVMLRGKREHPFDVRLVPFPAFGVHASG
jgi:hypothetical protein